LLSEEPRQADELREHVRLGNEEFDKALEKLEIHGGARRDFSGNVTVGGSGWKKTYGVQAQYRAEQFAKVLRYTELGECRMCALVRHFGDVEDARQPCGICDVCDPAGAVLRQFRRATAADLYFVRGIIEELRGVEYKATGTLQKALDPAGSVSRDEYEALLRAMVQARLIEIEEAVFEKDGGVIKFRKVRLTDKGRELRPSSPLELLISDGVVEEFAGASGGPASRRRTKSVSQSSAGKAGAAKGDKAKTASAAPVSLSAEGEALAARIREWRAAEARRLKVPAYVVLHDRTLAAVAHARPRTPKDLLRIEGIGQAKVDRFGDEILRICSAS
jgi:superfamily II DNA helicase RecQ